MVRPVGSVLVSAPGRTPQKLPYARVLTVYFEGRHPPRQGWHAGKFHPRAVLPTQTFATRKKCRAIVAAAMAYSCATEGRFSPVRSYDGIDFFLPYRN